MDTKYRSPNRQSQAGRRAISQSLHARVPQGGSEDEDVYAGDGMSSSEHVPAAAPSSTLFSDAPPPLDHTSNSAMVDPHTIDPFFEPLGTPARLIATASLARSLSAWTDGTPTIRIVPDTPSGAEVQRTRHGLHDALVRAGCWSIPGGGLVPSTMSRPSYPAGVADYPVSQARDPEQDGDDGVTTPKSRQLRSPV